MTDLPVSVIVVSRGRPQALQRCLTGLAQLQYAQFEIVVVADPQGIATAEVLPFAAALKLVPFDEANISAARNIGLCHAAGDVVAFIDDDAVPEPYWLALLAAPFGQSTVAASGGYVRGRNGISFQWKARRLDGFGAPQPFDIDPTCATVLHPPKGNAVKTEGTNMAFRRSVLVEIGGFDPAYHYFLDETDVNMRLAQAGHATALVPLAEVHHGFAENKLRSAARVPRDLFDIGASWAVFQRKHIRPDAQAGHWQSLRKAEHDRLLGHLISGGLEPRDVTRLTQRLDRGYDEGRARPLAHTALPRQPATPFLTFPSQSRKTSHIATRPIHLQKDRIRAAERVKNGEIVTLFNFSATALFHHVCFGLDGVWLQRGGLLGKSDRDQAIIRLHSRRRRVELERGRVATQRGFSHE